MSFFVLISLSSETVEAVIEESSKVITHIEREVEKLQSRVIVNKERIIEALNNFDSLFEEATNEERRVLIKEIDMEADRKSIKNIVIWFTEDDYFMKSAIPVSDVR